MFLHDRDNRYDRIGLALGDKIKSQDSDLEELFPWFLAGNGRCYGLVDDVGDIICEDRYIKLEFDCKWRPPVSVMYCGPVSVMYCGRVFSEQALLRDDLKKLSDAYPDYLIEVVYREPGMVLYGKVKYRGGACIESVSFTKEEYLDAYDEEYNDLVGGIEEEEYENFLKDHDKYLKDLEDFYPQYSDLVEKHILKRFKDGDLPLLVGYKWIDADNLKEFERRLRVPETEKV